MGIGWKFSYDMQIEDVTYSYTDDKRKTDATIRKMKAFHADHSTMLFYAE
jgi:hypothetical protein